MLNNSLSIENERNRIQDVVNSSTFAPNHMGNSQNGLFNRPECTASPMYRQVNEQDSFSNMKHAKTTVSRGKNPNNLMAANSNFGDEPGQTVSTIGNVSSLQAAIAQTASNKGIPKISNT